MPFLVPSSAKSGQLWYFNVVHNPKTIIRKEEGRPMRHRIQTTKTQQFIDITDQVAAAVRNSEVRDGIAVIYVPHTTAGVTINENADPDVVRDMLFALDKTYPVRGEYLHSEGNSHAHIKASLMGSSCTVIIEEGSLLLGTWQGIYFCEFDGPRNREYYVKIIRG
jgi:secondary thiamine-phosphate synthase enzyme